MTSKPLDKSLFQQYAKLEANRRHIEETQKELRKILATSIEQAGTERVVLEDLGSFSLVKRKTWSYSNDVEALVKNLKEKQTSEQQDGTATFEENITMSYYPNKD